MANVVRCAIYDMSVTEAELTNASTILEDATLISLVATTREQVDFGVWKVVGNRAIGLPKRRFPNQKFERQGWVGAKIYDAAIVEAFCNAFHCLVPWDDWADPNYLDTLLVSQKLKPRKLMLKNI